MSNVTQTYRAYREILRRDPCVYCGEPATGLDHIVPESRGIHRTGLVW